jgi:metal-responsive CopG/Arc/MetJ family transcriptional regulator
MNRKTANIDIRVEPELVEKIDTWRARQRVLPSRSAAIVYMLEEFLKHDSPPKL